MFFVSIAMTSGGFQAFSVTALVQLHDLELTTANAALTVYLVAGALGVLLGGPLADRTERYDAVAVVGFLAAAGLMAVVVAVALPFALLIAAFGLAGLMQGIIWPSRDMLVRSIRPPGASSKDFGFVSTGLVLAGARCGRGAGLFENTGCCRSTVVWARWILEREPNVNCRISR